MKLTPKQAGALYMKNIALEKEIDELKAKVDKLTRLCNGCVGPLQKCPITRRDLFMIIDGNATYGGPFDSYTIPYMQGDANEQWHERELVVERFDHDTGNWSDDEIIPLRIISEDVLFDLQEKAEQLEALRQQAKAGE
ncbi:hypothetical protein [Alishewanella sp. HL-SH06]|uniref:hypothetical protein n=1 Tax=Alishewanella sp. HL-SH06 TaxID=3461144 RepID=UPI00404164A6